MTPDYMVAQAKAMIEGQHKFLKNNTGLVNDPRKDLFILNPNGVLANNRHFIADTQMEALPNGTATTEGQSVQILGHCYAYLATGKKEYLDAAIWCFDAYVKFFYEGDPIPQTPQRWIANWICNGKEPTLANWPISPHGPTQGGYKGVPLEFVNGEAKIPHGPPFWGEYLDVTTHAYRGHLNYLSIKATPRDIVEEVDWQELYDNYRVTEMPEEPWAQGVWFDWASYLGNKKGYTVDWGTKLQEYPVSTMIAWTRNKIGIGPGPDDKPWSGDILSSDHALEDVGSIVLQDKTVNGVYLLNYAVRLPVEKGGYMFKRNEVWHNRPVHCPMLGSREQRGNAADAELWFADACYMLWQITGQDRYRRAMESVLFTLMEYTLIDAEDKFFRQSESATTPFTDGISYDWVYPGETEYEMGRNAQGFIHADVAGAAQYSLEQQAVRYRISKESYVVTEFGGVGKEGAPVQGRVDLRLAATKTSPYINYHIIYPNVVDKTPTKYRTQLKKLVRVEAENGKRYILADTRSVTSYGAVERSLHFEENILGKYDWATIRADFETNSGGLIIGNWLYDGGVRPLEAIVYKADGNFKLRVTDDDGWRWEFLLPDTGGTFIHTLLPKSEAILANYQPNNPGQPSPEAPNYEDLGQVEILPDGAAGTFAYFCLNDLPAQFEDDDGWTMYYRFTASCTEAFDAYIGDCYIENQRPDALNYCPGTIPFSNIYNQGAVEFAQWRGLPYPGYQHPIVFLLGEAGIRETHLNNMVDFMYDAQEHYFSVLGEMGPVAPAYIWDRPDAVVYGPANTWTMYHWGDGRPWSGYQPRAYFSGCRAWEYMVANDMTPPHKLVTYCVRWTQWLVDFIFDNDFQLPSDFYPDKKAEPGFNGHMVGLWLAGICTAYLAGCRVPRMEAAIEQIMARIIERYRVMPGKVNHPFNGTWPAWVSGDTQLPDGSWFNPGGFYGFHSGELLRGLGCYVIYKESMADAVDEIAHAPMLDLRFTESTQLDPRITFTRASKATYWGADGKLHEAEVNEPRFEHDPVTREPRGLLIEAASTNLVQWSEDLSNPQWDKNGVVTAIPTQEAFYADGRDVYRVVGCSNFSGDSSGHDNFRFNALNNTLLPNTVYTFSFWRKSPEGESLRVRVRNGSLEKTVTFVATGDWDFCSFTTETDSAGGFRLIFHGDPDFLMTAAQLEEGGRPTSYIPTAGSQVTRANDDTVIRNLENIGFNPNEGTLLIKATPLGFQTATFNSIFSVGESDRDKNRIVVYQNSSGTTTERVYDNNRTSNSIGSKPLSADDALRLAVSYSANGDFSFYVRGERIASVNVPDVDFSNAHEIELGRWRFNLNNYRRWMCMEQFAYYSKALSETELKALTE